MGGLITPHGRFTEEDTTLPTGQTPPNVGAGHGGLTTSNVNGVIYGFFVYPVHGAWGLLLTYFTWSSSLNTPNFTNKSPLLSLCILENPCI